MRTTRYSSTRLTLASTVASKSKVTTRIKTQTVKLSTFVGTMALAPWLSTASFAPTELCLISNTSFVTGGSMLIVLRWGVKAQNWDARASLVVISYVWFLFFKILNMKYFRHKTFIHWTLTLLQRLQLPTRTEKEEVWTCQTSQTSRTWTSADHAASSVVSPPAFTSFSQTVTGKHPEYNWSCQLFIAKLSWQF